MKILYLVNVDWFFISHRLSVALGALESGYEVHIATSLTQQRENLESYGFIVHPINVDRGSTNFLGSVRLFLSLLFLFLKN